MQSAFAALIIAVLLLQINNRTIEHQMGTINLRLSRCFSGRRYSSMCCINSGEDALVNACLSSMISLNVAVYSVRLALTPIALLQNNRTKTIKPLDIFRSCAIIAKLIDSATVKYGGLAQLGERLNGIQEVSGSIPLISTTKSSENFGFQNFFFVFDEKKF